MTMVLFIVLLAFVIFALGGLVGSLSSRVKE